MALLFLSGIAGDAQTPLACNTKAISAEQRPRYNELARKLRTSARDLRELDDGYALRIDGKSMSPAEVAEWIGMERLCCPFLRFQMDIEGAAPQFELRLRGPAGAKAILAAAFGQ